MSDIFREVEEDLRRDRLNRIWQRFGGYIIALAALIVLGTAGWRAYEYWAAKQAAIYGDRFSAAVELAGEGKHADAADALAALSGESGGSYALLARFRTAAEKAETGDQAGAVAVLDAVAADSGAPSTLRDLARIRAGYLLVDTASQADIAGRVENLAKAGNPWRHSAREVLGLSAWKAEDSAGAERWFTEIGQDQEAPQGVKGRADLFLTLIAGARPAP